MTSKTERHYSVWLGILSVLALVGLGAWIYQLSNGLIVTGMRNIVSWGLYITAFMFFVGLSAGGLIVSSSATVFNIPSFKKVALPAVMLSIVCIIVAIMFIVIDLGKPQRFLNLLLSPQFNSPLIWDVVVIGLYLLVSLAYLYLMTRPNPDERKLAIMSRIALPVAILVHSVTAWIFGLQIARVAWHSALMAPLFVASALDSGLALLLIVLWILHKLNIYEVEEKLFSSLAGLLAVFVAVDAFFVGSEILTLAYPGEETVGAALTNLLSGSLAPFFWGQVLLGLVIPFLILVFAKNRANQKLVLLASVLVVVGVFFKRVWLLFSSFTFPLIPDHLGVTLGEFAESVDSIVIPNIWATKGVYFPSIFEGLIFIGISSFGVVLYAFLVRRFIQKSKNNQMPKTVNMAGNALGGK